MRTKWAFNVYSIASYAQEGGRCTDTGGAGQRGRSEDALPHLRAPVDGADLAKSFRESVALNHPAPAFAAELDALAGYFQEHPVRQGRSIWLSSEPNAGFRCQLTVPRR